MRILIMGGTRFIGVYLTKTLVAQGHEVVLLNRGNKPVPVSGVSEDVTPALVAGAYIVRQIKCDRSNVTELKDKLVNESFDVVFDNNGRELSDTQPLVEILGDQLQHFIYVSSAGVYLKSSQMPHKEGDAVDPKSRHQGKHQTEAYLAQSGISWTSIRPTYIYGPQNYNDLEAWFFDRLIRDRPIPIPGNGLHFTQFGHVGDLAEAMAAVIGNSQAKGQIYNISGDRYVTFDGLALACAEAMGKTKVKLIHYDPSQFDFGKRKAFPLRVQHFFADISKAKQELNWQPKYDLVSGLEDSYQNDYLVSGRDASEIDFSLDDEILGAM
jgi:nucleoside-diphosphate-sugar epimerase